MSRRRKYSAEFKREAVAMANQPGIPLSQLARELGINANCWDTGAGFPAAGGPRFGNRDGNERLRVDCQRDEPSLC